MVNLLPLQGSPTPSRRRGKGAEDEEEWLQREGGRAGGERRPLPEDPSGVGAAAAHGRPQPRGLRPPRAGRRQRLHLQAGRRHHAQVRVNEKDKIFCHGILS